MGESSEGVSPYSVVTKNNETLTARPYQIQLFEQALKSNKIIFLGTGTGKTFIAVLLIKEMALPVCDRSWEKGAKRTVFLANTVPLVKQQAKYIEDMTPFQVSHYVGEMGVDFWVKDEWTKEFQENEVLVMSVQIFLDILEKKYISVDRVNLLIIDECHHAAVRSKHPMHEVMRQVYERCGDQPGPRILGLTASVINRKIKVPRLNEFMRGLECTMKAEIATADDIHEAWKYGTKAKQVIVTYSTCEPSAYVKVKQLLDEFTTNFTEAPEFKKIIQGILTVLVTMGSWCGLKSVEMFLQDEDDDYGSCEEFVTLLHNIKEVYEEEMSNYSEKQRLFHFRSEKLKTLMETLARYEKEQLYGVIFVEQRFVCKVLSAYLKAVFEDWDPKSPIGVEWIVGGISSSFFKASDGVLVHQGVKAVSETGILSRFRRHELNLLVATSILEEGLDVPKCSLVLRYDPPKDFRSYVQSRGRARAENASYVMLLSDGEKPMVVDELITYCEIEQLLKNSCSKSVPVQQSEVVEAFNDLIIPHYEPFGKNGPKITAISSVATLYKYCGRLAHDRFSNPVPIWRCFKDGRKCLDASEEDTHSYFDGVALEDMTEGEQIGYVYEMIFPIASPIKNVVAGPPMKSKQLAKCACALLACELLHRNNELEDEHLQPIDSLESSDDDSDDDDVGERKVKTGTARSRRYHKKAVPDELTVTDFRPSSKVVLYSITLKLVKPIDEKLNPRGYKIFHPEESDRCLAILTTKDIPQLEPFLLYTRWGEISVTLKETSRDFTIGKSNYADCALFHFWVFDTILSFREEKPFFFNSYNYFIVPLKRGDVSIDFDFINEVKKHVTTNFHKPLSKEEANAFVFQEKNYTDAILCTTYMDSNDPAYKNVQKYSVEEVCHSMKPTTEFPGERYDDYQSYFRLKYGVNVLDLQQPLLKCEIFNHRLNVLVPRVGDDEATKKLSTSRDSPHIVAELCRIHIIPASLYRQIIFLPSILKRISVLLTSNTLRRRIAAEAKVGSLDPPPLGFVPRTLQFYENVDLRRHPGPSASTILQAFTPSKTMEAFNLERLEMIGDSFLKMSISISCYMNYDLHHEGKLTSKRSKFISNKNLYRRAECKQLTELINGPLFIPHRNWIPPGYNVRNTIEEALMDADVPEHHWNIAPIRNQLEKKTKEEIINFLRNEDKRLTNLKKEDEDSTDEKTKTVGLRGWRLLSDKSVADSIEALIGAYLISCGPEATQRVMSWLGLPVQAEEFPEFVPFSAPRDGYCVNVNAELLQQRMKHLVLKLEDLERTIGYRFKEKSFLVQAMTHGSYDRNKVTQSYERLEFLGDAVLDYLVTWHIYHSPKKMSPGDLTDLRSALVNNVAFGALAIKWKLHQHLKHMAPKLQQAIDRFCTLQEDNNYEVEEVWCYVQENESEELEEVEVPKVLGDIFESLAGAIYLDSNMDLKEVWRVFQPMLQPLIDKFQKNIPLNPVRELRELRPSVKFSKAVPVKFEGVKITATVGKKDYIGIGRNRKLAKTAASKAALRHLKKRNN